MTATIKGMRELRARMEAIKKVGRPISQEWALRTVAGAKRKVQRKTGNTGRTIHVASVTDHGATVAAAGAAVFLEGGTKPHVIVPRRRKVLRFAPAGSGTLSGRPRKGGGVIFARRVRHPGTRAYPFMRPAGEEAIEQVGIRAVVKVWNDAA